MQKQAEPNVVEVIREVEVIKEVESEKSSALKKQIKQLEDELADARIEINRGVAAKAHTYDTFKKICERFYLGINDFGYLEYNYEQMSVDELQIFIQTIEEVEQELENITNRIGEVINGKEKHEKVS